MTTTRRTRTATLLATAGATAVVALTGFAGSAQAYCVVGEDADPCPQPPQVHAVGTVSVNPATTLGVRLVPRQDARQVRQLANGAKAFITCQTKGSRVSGTFGTTRIWDHLKAGGYVSDAYVRTGTDGFVKGMPRC